MPKIEELLNQVEEQAVAEMHQLTITELSAIKSTIYRLWSKAVTIHDYRNSIGDEHNAFLLQAENVVIVGDDENE